MLNWRDLGKRLIQFGLGAVFLWACAVAGLDFAAGEAEEHWLLALTHIVFFGLLGLFLVLAAWRAWLAVMEGGCGIAAVYVVVLSVASISVQGTWGRPGMSWAALFMVMLSVYAVSAARGVCRRNRPRRTPPLAAPAPTPSASPRPSNRRWRFPDRAGPNQATERE